MSENSKIEWCDHTFNPWIGCTKIGPGCDNCYASVSTPARTMGIAWGAGATRHHTAHTTWAQPKTWNDQADAFQTKHGRRQRVFCASLADVFDNAVNPQWRADLFALIAQTPNIDWLLLTKRIGNVNSLLPPDSRGSPHSWGCGWANVWIGATIVNQEEAERDIPKLLALPAAKRFLSMEPLLGPVDIAKWIDPDLFTGCADDGITALDWVIVGGESGPGARPMHPDWARSLRDQCQAASVPFLFKQWGEYRPATSVQEATTNPVISQNRKAIHAIGSPAYSMPNFSGCYYMPHQVESMIDGSGQYAASDCAMLKAGKKAAGRLLDGITHDGYPSE